MNRFILRRITHLDSWARDLDRREAATQALEARRELCELAREHLVDGHPWLIDRWLDLADNHRQLGHLDQAERTYSKILTALESQPQGDRSRIAGVLNTLGVFYCETRRPRKAVGPFRRALDLVAELPPDNAALATLHNNLASALHSSDEPQYAQRHYRAALGIFERATPSLAEAHCRCDLAELLAEEDEEEEEEALDKIAGARRLFAELLAPGSAERGMAFMRIADLYCRLARFRLARPVLEEATEAFSRSGDHPEQLSECLSILSQLESESLPMGRRRNKFPV